MTEPQPEITAGAAIAIARMEATLDGVKRQIDHQDRNTGQLVKLFEERMMGKFTDIERRLDSMEHAREQARVETARERSELDTRLRELERGAEGAAERVASEAKALADKVATEAKVEAKGLDARLKLLEEFRWKLVGVMAGVGLVAGGSGAVIAKAIGGL